MADKWAQAGFAPVKTAPNPIEQKRRLEPLQAQESINASRMSQATAAADLRKAPTDLARAQVALGVDRAIADAEIRKAIAQADISEQEAVAARIKARYPQLTEAQATAAARVVLMEEGNKLYASARKQGFEPTNMMNRLASVAKAVPVAGEGLADIIRSPAQERAALGERLFTEGALRTVTGAAGPKEERPEVRTQYFPSPWQSPNRQTRNDLEAIRNRQIATIRNVAGPAASPATTLPKTERGPPKLPPGLTPAGARAQARAAIAAGKDRALVLQRLQQLGVDTTGL